MDEKGLLQLKERITNAEKEASQLDGQKEYLLRSLKEQFGVSSIEAAEKKLSRLEETIKRKGEKLEQAIAQIEEKYNG